jgi:predicted amidophosphoribosyltransferase
VNDIILPKRKWLLVLKAAQELLEGNLAIQLLGNALVNSSKLCPIVSKIREKERRFDTSHELAQRLDEQHVYMMKARNSSKTHPNSTSAFIYVAPKCSPHILRR